VSLHKRGITEDALSKTRENIVNLKYGQMSGRFIKFIITRLLGTLVDTLVLWILTRYLLFSYVGQYIVAPAISFEVAMFHNYVLSYYYIWNKYVPVRAGDFYRRLIAYNISSLLGFFVKMGFLILLERLFGWDVLICNVFALLISGFVNFFLAERVVFKRRSKITAE
jgi:putative flippase GtrA